MKVPLIEDAVLQQWAQGFLEAKGATVLWPGDEQAWLTPAELYRSLPAAGRISMPGFHSRLRSDACPKVPRRTKGGRLVALVPSDALQAYLTRPIQPGRAL